MPEYDAVLVDLIRLACTIASSDCAVRINIYGLDNCAFSDERWF